jgi:hypothetical protein
MAVAVVMEFEGGTLDQYDQVMQLMNLRQGGPMPNGGISHFVTATPAGLLITDIWESREQFERFAEEQIGPFSQEAGIPGPPKMTFYDVHNYLVTAPSGVAA